MTKEELEKEAEEYAEENQIYVGEYCSYNFLVKAYLAGAEPREKQIQIDAEQVRALQKQNGELTDELAKKSDTNHQLVEQLAKLNERCSELEAQVEKMKKELHHRLVSPSHSDSDCLDKIIGLDRLWQFGQEF